MKCYRTIYLFFILFVVVMIISCVCLKMSNNKTVSTENNESNGTILHGMISIDSKVIENFPLFLSSENVGIPFLQTAQVLGMHIEKNNGIIYIISENIVYELQHSPNISLTKQGEKINLLLPPFGCSSPYIQYNSEINDIFLDYETLDGTFYLMGVDIDTSVDYAKPVVTMVTQKTGDGSLE